ncbi:MAG: RagB/SusD family nutrient uptake outer membrane protein, partial [Bacteroidales bacterium]|nr:RagB/SusD family nutrient uptake outer membrane protein [Bacteroidales bacterium]
MKKYNIILGLFIAISVLFAGCEKHLDVLPVSSITAASYWQGEDDAISYLYGIYAEYRSLTNTQLYSERRADLLDNGPQAPLLSSEYTHTLTVDSDGQNWRGFYEVIHHCNLLITKMDELDIGNEDIRAEALTLRALTYFQLIKIFGDVPINLEPTATVPEEFLGRSSISAVMTQIKSDINSAIDFYSTDGIGD